MTSRGLAWAGRLAAMLVADLFPFLDAPELAAPVYVPMETARRPAPAARSKVAADLGLSARQAEVLGLLLKGLPNKLIARTLDISENTTKIHVSAVLRALGVRNRTQAVIAAARIGLRFPD